MNALEPIIAADQAPTDEEPPFVIASPPPGAPATALVFACPHAGRVYPADLMAASRLDARAIRRSEDAHVDLLLAAAPAFGATVVTARMARAWFDVNRQPWDLDPAMFADELPAFARGRSARVAAGLGSIARTVGDGEDIYHRKLTFSEAAARVERVWRPYHEALAAVLAHTRASQGAAVLVDWHSMPSAAAGPGGGTGGCDVVLGDRFGSACAPALTRLVEGILQSMGYRVARNLPYAGGFTTEHYGRPQTGTHALQIEINRAIYMDERTLAPHKGFARLAEDLKTLFSALAAVTLTDA